MVMCNENNDKKSSEEYDYRFFDYRLTQLETNLRKGQEKLELDQQSNYKELITMLQVMQEGNNEQTKQIVEISQKQEALAEKMKCIDKLKEAATSHKEQINTLYHRMDIYKQIGFLIGGTAVSAFIMAVFELITK